MHRLLINDGEYKSLEMVNSHETDYCIQLLKGKANFFQQLFDDE